MPDRVFRDRNEAGLCLGEQLLKEGYAAKSGDQPPLVLGIPRGGIALAVPVADMLGGELDVVLSRKLRAPYQPELAIGAVSEDGKMALTPEAASLPGVNDRYIREERRRQLAEIARRGQLYRAVRPQATLAGRTVILVDDGIATGATMIAAIHTARAAGAREVVVAVPVGSPERLAAIGPLCDRLVCLEAPADFLAVGQFYREFPQVEDADVVRLLARHARPAVVSRSRSWSAG
jgi:putative phosphoribosyl transferase